MGRRISRSPALVASRRTSLVLPTAGHSVLRHVEVLYLLWFYFIPRASIPLWSGYWHFA